MTQRLPNRPHFELLRRHAKDALRVGRVQYPTWQLADAQHALARGHGFAGWAELKRDVMSRAQLVPERPAVDRESEDAGRHPFRALAPACVAGTWRSRGDSERVALEIVDRDGSLVMTQVFTYDDGRCVANTLTIRADGRAHPLPGAEELTIQAAWSDLRTLQTIVRGAGVIVADGIYVVAADGHTMTATVSGRRLVFERVESRAVPALAPIRSTPIALLVATAAAIVCSGCAGIASPGTVMPSLAREAADRRAIAALNRGDVAAGLAGDLDAVVAQWSDDFVVMPPTGHIVRGKAANAAIVRQARSQLERFEPVAYDTQFEEITVAGDYAFAWGIFHITARVRETASDVRSSGKLLRIYQRQPDGRWLMHRTMSTIDPSPVLAAK